MPRPCGLGNSSRDLLRGAAPAGPRSVGRRRRMSEHVVRLAECLTSAPAPRDEVWDQYSLRRKTVLFQPGVRREGDGGEDNGAAGRQTDECETRRVWGQVLLDALFSFPSLSCIRFSWYTDMG